MRQYDIIVEKLERDGEVSRNFALRNYISRLSAIIYSLRREGYVFSAEYKSTPYGKDYVYTVIKKPDKGAK